MSVDLDAIGALIDDPYQYAQVSPEVTRGYLAALLAELRATTADLAVAVDVARERGEALDIYVALHDELRSTLAACADRMDEFTYQELASSLDDGAVDRFGEQYTARLAVAEAENERLRAVAEAARDLIDCDPDTAQLDYLIELEDAVNAWRAGGDE